MLTDSWLITCACFSDEKNPAICQLEKKSSNVIGEKKVLALCHWGKKCIYIFSPQICATERQDKLAAESGDKRYLITDTWLFTCACRCDEKKIYIYICQWEKGKKIPLRYVLLKDKRNLLQKAMIADTMRET